jgi:diguanylate cyclase (GGDEF)-like protein
MLLHNVLQKMQVLRGRTRGVKLTRVGRKPMARTMRHDTELDLDDTEKEIVPQSLPRHDAENIVNILLVEDSQSDARLFERILSKAADADQFWLVHVKRISKAIKFVRKEKFDVILLDLNLPDCHGLESIDAIRGENHSCPIIVLTGTESDKMGIEAVRRGAQDYLMKGSLDSDALSAAIKYAIERHKIISEVEKEKDRQSYLVAHDTLTGLPNLKMVRYLLEHAIRHAAKTSKMFGVLFIDIENFKKLIESYGHAAGDELLKVFSKRLVGSLRSGDTAARVGVDEFIVLLEDLARCEDAALTTQRLIDTLATNYKIHGQYMNPALNVGISVYPKDEQTVEGLVSAADFAMLQAKQIGQNKFCYFSPNMNVKAQEMKELEMQLHHALAQNQMEIHYQPEFEIATGKISGVQALLRWNHPSLGIVAAKHFIPFIEHLDLLHTMNEWVLDSGAAQILKWKNAGFGELYLSVHLPLSAFSAENFIPKIGKILQRSGIDPSSIRFEVQEKNVLVDREKHLAFLKDLQSLGVQILLEGFGAGFSSITNLESLPVSSIKIDRGLIHKVTNNDESQIILKAIVQLARGLKIKTIGEAVETREQFEVLRQCGCDIAQGFFLSKPVTRELMSVLLKTKSLERLK